MRNRFPVSDELQSLVDAVVNETLADEQVKRLEELLASNPEWKRYFYLYCQLHIDLDVEIRSQRIVDTFCLPTGDRARSNGYAPPATPPSAKHRARRRPTSRFSSRSWLALATCLALLLIPLGIYFGGRPDGHVDIGNAPLDRIQSPDDVIIVKLATAESRTLPIGDVGTVSIQGPAYFELFGDLRARLRQGRIKVRIDDERGRGFVVETPRGRVTDLGTEFGVDVDDQSKTDVIVFQGAVDLAMASTARDDAPRIERLVQGEALSLSSAGHLGRIMTVVTGNVPTFQRRGEERAGGKNVVIADVWDNIRSFDFKKFYEIVPGGLREDVLAYADRREHNWNGTTPRGMPEYLIGADYVKPFNSDKMRGDVEVNVTLGCPARLFVFFDDRVAIPDWLRAGFRDTGDDIGVDAGVYELEGLLYAGYEKAKGPGNSVDAAHSIWEQIVPLAGTVTLGPNSAGTDDSTMYGIAAVPLDPEPESKESD